MNYVDRNTPVHEHDGFENDATWILHLTHVSHDRSYDAYVRVPSKLDYNYIYRVIARLQFKHSEGSYKTEDLSGQQVAFLLGQLLNLDIVADRDKNWISDETITVLSNEYIYGLDLFWNWEEVVVKFGFDENSRSKGENPYFYPDVFFKDYEPDGTVPAILEMDKHFH